MLDLLLVQLNLFIPSSLQRFSYILVLLLMLVVHLQRNGFFGLGDSQVLLQVLNNVQISAGDLEVVVLNVLIFLLVTLGTGFDSPVLSVFDLLDLVLTSLLHLLA
jgi:hypothetical protein